MGTMLEIVFYIVYLFIYAGFFFYKSGTPQIGPYSTRYFVFLIVLAVPLLLPTVVRQLVKKIGKKNFLFALIPSIVLFIILYVSVALIHYSRYHPFDPYLQHPPPEFDVSELEKPEDTIRILTLGGSTTKNGHLPAEDRYPAVLEKLLRSAHPEMKIEVFNGGQDTFTTKHSLINYVTNMKDWKPDIVIIMHGINDLYRSCLDPDYTMGDYNRLWSHFYGSSVKAAKPRSFIEELFLKPLLSKWYAAYLQIEEDRPLDQYRSLPDFKRYLTSLVSYLKHDGVKVILMTEPYLYKDAMTEDEKLELIFGKMFCKKQIYWIGYAYPSPGSLKEAMDAFNKAAIEVAKEQGVAYIDLERLIPKNTDYFIDDVHYTKLGSEKAAEFAAESITKNKLLE
jgi:lysophospholipase L1-like esterase